MDDWLRTTEEVLMDLLAVGFRDKPAQAVSCEHVAGVQGALHGGEFLS